MSQSSARCKKAMNSLSKYGRKNNSELYFVFYNNYYKGIIFKNTLNFLSNVLFTGWNAYIISTQYSS